MSKQPRQIKRSQYLRQVIQALQFEPSSFMLAVTYNTPNETKLYDRINELYQRGVSLETSKVMLKRSKIEWHQNRSNMKSFETYNLTP